MKLAAAVLAAAFAACASAQEQIHLSLTGVPTEMAASWAYPRAAGEEAACRDSYLNYAPASGGQTKRVPGAADGEIDSLCLYTAVMTGLTAHTKYAYRIDNSTAHAFVNQPVRAGGKVYAVLADFGIENDKSMAQLVAEAQNGEFDMVIHAGDYAYDLETDKGDVGNRFMKAIEPVAAILPYMGCPGNHEADPIGGAYTFEQYRRRFNAFNITARHSGSSRELWYSFDDGLVHWVSIDTEVFAYGASKAEIDAQYDWLKQDLAAVDRKKTPWVAAMGHKSYWMDKVDFTKLNDIMQGHVDVNFVGHQHNYQRLEAQNNGVVEHKCMSADKAAYHKCTNVITIVVGSPGCKEGLSDSKAPAGVAAYNKDSFGYGHFRAVNATHAAWHWEEAGQRNLATGAFEPKLGAFADKATIIRAHHA